MNDDDFAELFRKLPGPSSGTSWHDVGAEFAELGRTLGDVLRSTWNGQDSAGGLGQLREAVESLTDQMNSAIDGSPEARQARDQLRQLTESIREAAAQAGDEVRPELVNLLRQANAELRRISRLDQSDAAD
jgi:hypothetical protein